MKRRSVIEQQRGFRGERCHEPVPHHPAAGREVEDTITALDVAVKLVLFQMLNERPAGAMHDAFRNAGGAGGIENVERMIERERFERWFGRLSRADPLAPPPASRHAADGRLRVRVGHDHGVFHRRQGAHDFGDPRQHVVAFAAIEIAVGGNQEPRFDLAKPIEDTLHAEVRRTG